MTFGVEQWAFTLDLIGKILIGVAVIRVHGILRHEKKFDKKVMKSIKKEKWWTYLGILFLILGWLMHVFLV